MSSPDAEVENRIPLGPGRYATVIVPKDLTEAEAHRLAGAIVPMGIPQAGSHSMERFMS